MGLFRYLSQRLAIVSGITGYPEDMLDLELPAAPENDLDIGSRLPASQHVLLAIEAVIVGTRLDVLDRSVVQPERVAQIGIEFAPVVVVQEADGIEIIEDTCVEVGIAHVKVAIGRIPCRSYEPGFAIVGRWPVHLQELGRHSQGVGEKVGRIDAEGTRVTAFKVARGCQQADVRSARQAVLQAYNPVVGISIAAPAHRLEIFRGDDRRETRLPERAARLRTPCDIADAPAVELAYALRIHLVAFLEERPLLGNLEFEPGQVDCLDIGLDKCEIGIYSEVDAQAIRRPPADVETGVEVRANTVFV